MLPFLSLFVVVLFGHTLAQQQQQSAGGNSSSPLELVYMTLSSGANPQVRVAVAVPNYSEAVNLTLSNGTNSNGTSLAAAKGYGMSGVDRQITPSLADRSVDIYFADLGDADDLEPLSYSVGNSTTKIPVAPLPTGNDTTLTVCVFGDYSANLYYNKKGMDIGSVVENNQCQLNLFIGRLNWELSNTTGLYSFNPYVTLYHPLANGIDKLTQVPCIFGETGHDLRETSYFQVVELNGVAFIQITVEVLTIAKLTPGTEQQTMVQAYFRESMYNELECKLQELYNRPERPWIVLYITHPYEINENTGPERILAVNDTDRLFDIARRYRIDLLTSCGAEGMAVVLAQRQNKNPDAKLPAYLQTTMVPCAGYQASNPTLQSECSYAVLQFNHNQLRYLKKSFENVNGGFGAGTTQDSGSVKPLSDETITKTTEMPEKCVPADQAESDDSEAEGGSSSTTPPSPQQQQNTGGAINNQTKTTHN